MPRSLLLTCVSALLLTAAPSSVQAFLAPSTVRLPRSSSADANVVGGVVVVTRRTALCAGGFEWEDPGQAFEQGVDNPFKNPDLVKDSEEGMKIDPARLLSPRLNGSNVYLIGMMGSGKVREGQGENQLNSVN
jgi:hypothetical protein